MSVLEAQTKRTKLHVTYDKDQHCTALEGTVGKMVAADVPRSCGGKGEEFSPIELVGAGLGSCMLLSMGTLASRDKLDISGATVDVDVSLTDKPVFRIGALDLQFNMPRNFSEEERGKLEKAAHACPIKPSMHPDIPISVQFIYPSS